MMPLWTSPQKLAMSISRHCSRPKRSMIPSRLELPAPMNDGRLHYVCCASGCQQERWNQGKGRQWSKPSTQASTSGPLLRVRGHGTCGLELPTQEGKRHRRRMLLASLWNACLRFRQGWQQKEVRWKVHGDQQEEQRRWKGTWRAEWCCCSSSGRLLLPHSIVGLKAVLCIRLPSQMSAKSLRLCWLRSRA